MYVANWPEVVLSLVGSLPVRSVVCGRGRSVSEGEDTEMKLRRHLFQQLRRLKAWAAIVVLPLRHNVVYRSCRASRQCHADMQRAIRVELRPIHMWRDTRFTTTTHHSIMSISVKLQQVSGLLPIPR